MPEVRQHQTTHAGFQADGDISMAQTGMQGMPFHVADPGADKHRDKDADRGLEVHRCSDTPSPERKEQSKTKAQSLQHRAPEETTVVTWPFMYSYRDGNVNINKAAPTTKYQDACSVGAAIF
jgi:hypothetical protein